jgi:rhamnosyl/mannosyltransferase
MAARPLNICHLGKFYPPAPGGIETHVRTLARAQAQLGAHVRVICINHADRKGRDVTWARYGATQTVEEADGDVEVTRLGRSGCVARLDFVPGLPALLNDLQYRPLDILHLHMPNPTMLMATASLRLNVPLVITHHSDVVRQRMLRLVYRPFEKLAYARASSIVCSSRGYADASPLVQQHADKVDLLPMGLNLDRFIHPSQAALDHADQLRAQYGEIIWLCVGRCVYYKGLNTALDALANVPGVLIIVGHGPLEKQLRDRARRRWVADRVVWPGYATQDQLIGAYHAAKALWFPSSHRSEAFGLVQVEAMASGCPVINTHIRGSGVPWVSRHEQTGLTVPVNDPHALASAARRLLEDRRLHARLAAAAKERASKEFDHQTMAQRSLEIYDIATQRARRMIPTQEPTRPMVSRWVRQMMDDRIELPGSAQKSTA